MRVEIIDNITNFSQFEAQNVFQTEELLHLFVHEKGTKIVLFVVYDDCKLTMIQPVVISRYYRHLPGKLASFAVAWREPWRNPEMSDDDACEAFVELTRAIEKYCRSRALYLEFRHFAEDNIYHTFLISHYKSLPWYNIYRQLGANESVEQGMNKSKRKQLRQSFDAGVKVELNPSSDEIREWYGLLKRLYRRIHRPLPSLEVFLRLNKSKIGRVFVVTYRDRVISGSAMLYLLRKEKNSQLSTLSTKAQRPSVLNSQLFYDWYRASIDEQIEGIYPSVVSTWQAMQLVANMGGGTFDFMGAGPRNKHYGVRDFKLTFGGDLTPEYRYRKYLFLK